MRSSAVLMRPDAVLWPSPGERPMMQRPPATPSGKDMSAFFSACTISAQQEPKIVGDRQEPPVAATRSGWGSFTLVMVSNGRRQGKMTEVRSLQHTIVLCARFDDNVDVCHRTPRSTRMYPPPDVNGPVSMRPARLAESVIIGNAERGKYAAAWFGIAIRSMQALPTTPKGGVPIRDSRLARETLDSFEGFQAASVVARSSCATRLRTVLPATASPMVLNQRGRGIAPVSGPD
jgi:hypothetical protein